MSKVLIIYHSFTGKTKELAEAAAEGAKSVGAEVVLKEAVDTNVQDLVAVDTILVATPQPFRIMAGETKKLFERLWKDREQIGEGKPFGVIICYANDPTATIEALDRLCGSYKFTKCGDWAAVKRDELEGSKESCRQLGIALASLSPLRE